MEIRIPVFAFAMAAYAASRRESNLAQQQKEHAEAQDPRDRLAKLWPGLTHETAAVRIDLGEEAGDCEQTHPQPGAAEGSV